MRLPLTLLFATFFVTLSAQQAADVLIFSPTVVYRRDKLNGKPVGFWGKPESAKDFIDKIFIKGDRVVMMLQGKPVELEAVTVFSDTTYSPIGLSIASMGTKLNRDGDFSAHLFAIDGETGIEYQLILNFKEYQYRFLGSVLIKK